jgi:DNA-directed RNA polymerase I subunit RPA43
VAVVARELGKLWASMSLSEKEIYQVRAAEERAKTLKDTEAWIAAGGIVPDPVAGPINGCSAHTGSSTVLHLPVAKIRKICKLDPEVKGLSREAVLLITKMAEVATVKLAQECVKVAQIQNRRKLLPDDVAQVCATREQFTFLREDIQDLVLENQRVKHAHDESNGKSSTSSKNEAGVSSKPLTAYFGVK